MLIHLIRHAHAGARGAWKGKDDERPLTAKGEAQARAIAEQLAGDTVDTVWSSRFVRCRQTVEPIARAREIEVVDHPLLVEGTPGADALEALLAAAAAGRHLVACSHGDVIPAIVAAALGRGADLDGPPTLSKAARYRLVVTEGTVTRIEHVPTPALTIDPAGS